jgi:hypothetical protein
MTKPDRLWVLSILDMLDKYEEEHPEEEANDEEEIEVA